MKRQLIAEIECESDGLVAIRPQVDVASHGDTIQKARAKLEVAANWAVCPPGPTSPEATR